MRRKAWSKRAVLVEALAHDLQLKLYGDPNWSLLESAMVETPIGEVHFHWINRHGAGRWNIVTHPQWRGEICGTVRCRKVFVTPHGGENEAVPIKVPTYGDVQEQWVQTHYAS